MAWVTTKHTSKGTIRCAERTSAPTLISFPSHSIVSLIYPSAVCTPLFQRSPTIALIRGVCVVEWAVHVPEKERCQRSLRPCSSPPFGGGAEGGQRQRCRYPAPFPRLPSHRHSGHRRMKRLWISLLFILLPYTHQNKKIRQKMCASRPIRSSFKQSSLVQ